MLHRWDIFFHFPLRISHDTQISSILDKASVKVVVCLFPPAPIIRAFLYHTTQINRQNTQQVKASVCSLSSTVTPSAELPRRSQKQVRCQDSKDKGLWWERAHTCPAPSLFSTETEGKGSPIFAAVASLEHRKLHSAAGTRQMTREGIVTQLPASFFSWELLNRTAASAVPGVLPYTRTHETCWCEDVHSCCVFSPEESVNWFWCVSLELHCPVFDVFHVHFHSMGLAPPWSLSISQTHEWPFSCQYLKAPTSYKNVSLKTLKSKIKVYLSFKKKQGNTYMSILRVTQVIMCCFFSVCSSHCLALWGNLICL